MGIAGQLEISYPLVFFNDMMGICPAFRVSLDELYARTATASQYHVIKKLTSHMDISYGRFASLREKCMHGRLPLEQARLPW